MAFATDVHWNQRFSELVLQTLKAAIDQRSGVNLKLLQLAQVGIGTRSTGSRIRNYYLAKQLASVMKVTHLGFGDDGHTVEASDSTDGIRMRLIPRERAYTLTKLARGALGRTPVTLFNFYNEAMAAALR